jgi:hypothetical protein
VKFKVPLIQWNLAPDEEKISLRMIGEVKNEVQVYCL